MLPMVRMMRCSCRCYIIVMLGVLFSFSTLLLQAMHRPSRSACGTSATHQSLSTIDLGSATLAGLLTP
eukprot:6103615-Amphidinium_carterae.1